MGKRMGRYTVVMGRKPAILGYAAICGKKESEGPLGAAFDLTYEDTTLGEKSWEKAESRLQKEAVNCAMKNAGVTAGAVDYIFAGDLLGGASVPLSLGIRRAKNPYRPMDGNRLRRRGGGKGRGRSLCFGGDRGQNRRSGD